MINKVRKLTASLIVALLVVTAWSSASWSQDEGRRLDSGASANTSDQAGAKRDAMSDGEKLVRDVYARLMRYQSAGIDELLGQAGKSSEPNDYLTFELRNIRSGSLAEIIDRPLADFVTVKSDAGISLKPVHLSEKDGPPHAYYEAQWTTTAASEDQSALLISELAAIKDFNGYTSCEVRVHLQGKQNTYKILVLYPGTSTVPKGVETVRSSPVRILDNVTIDMNTVYADESPPVRSPWQKYVKTSLYQAVVRTIRERKAAGAPLIPLKAPIGYLPGDDVSPTDQDAQTLAAMAPCPATTVSITVSGVANADKSTVGGLVVLNSDGNNAPRLQITVEKAQPTTYTGNVTLTRNNTKVKVFTAATSGTEITFNGTDNRFANTSLPKTLFVEGAAFSASMRDVTLQVASDDGATDQATVTVLWVDQPTVSFSGPLAGDNAAKQAYINWTTAGADALGLQTYNANFGARMGWGSEAAGVVHPAGFNYPSNDLKLERDVAFNDWIGNGASSIGSRNFSNTIPPGNDTGPAQAMDSDPQPNGNIYDWDAAGLDNTVNSPLNEIRRTRNNFKAFASITVNGTAVRCSQVRLYFVRFSMRQTTSPSGHNWVVINPPDVANDNQAAHGTTRLTWNLQ